MPSSRLLLVAPETDLRKSLLFALEAEGFEVTLRDAPPTHGWLAKNRFDCTILDQKALVGEPYEAIAFCIKAHPVVLLAARPHPWLLEWVAGSVELPLSGHDIIAAIRAAAPGDAA